MGKKTSVLSPTQLRLMELLVGGSHTKQAAAVLGMDMHTANTHVHRAKKKLGAKTRDHAIAIFTRQKVKEEI